MEATGAVDAWPQVARDPKATPFELGLGEEARSQAQYVVLTTRSDFPWSNRITSKRT
jgi:hypothetical protein